MAKLLRYILWARTGWLGALLGWSVLGVVKWVQGHQITIYVLPASIGAFLNLHQMMVVEPEVVFQNLKPLILNIQLKKS